MSEPFAGFDDMQRRILVDLVIQQSRSYDCKIDNMQAEALIRHLELVLLKNNSINLTRITDPEEAVILHIVDSLLYTKGLPENDMRDARFVDIGTGAGYPGIPFSIATGLHGVLLDSVGKKVGAVNGFIHKLGLDDMLVGVNERAEGFAAQHKHSYDIVLARAVSQTATLVEYASPFLKMGGRLIISKGSHSEDELSLAHHACKVCGMTDVSRETFELPQGLGHREILCFVKRRKESIRLPRDIGQAQHHPL